MEWYAIDKKYVNYLKKYDKFVPNIDYKNKMKCFLGVILTTEGIIEYSRYRLYAVNDAEYPDSVKNFSAYYGSTSIYPLDAYLGIDHLPFKATVDAALRIAKVGADSSSYIAASQRLKEDFNLNICDNQIREIVDYIGEIILQEDIRLTKESLANYSPKNIRSARSGRRPRNGFVLFVKVDGAMFSTRPAKDDASGSKQKKEQESSGKENKLGVVFRSDKLIAPGVINNDYRRICRTGEIEYVATTKGIDEFQDRLLCVMIRNGLEDASDVVLISDGTAWIRKAKEKYFPSATHILDLFYLKENTIDFGKYIFHNDKSKYTPWWKEVYEQLESGQWQKVLDRPEIAIYKEEKDTPNGVVNLYHYIWNNRDIIDYPTYKAKGYFVGSGAIESGNKTALQELLKLAGERYIESAETLLALRTKLRSGLWDSLVVPFVYRLYSQWHRSDNSIRNRQRAMHKKKTRYF